MSAFWKTVRIFISSTFRDMQAERDHLVRFVFPRLREDLLNRHIHLVDVDLRWGVTSEQDASQVCREIINECRPRFLCMLGGRYGWVPPGKTRSITADEVHFGVLDRTLKDRGFAYFYFRNEAATAAMVESISGEFREPPGSDNQNKLAELKHAIVAAGLNPFSYLAQWDSENRRLAGLKRFGDRVYDDLIANMRSDPELRDRFAAEVTSQSDEVTEENDAMAAFVEERSQRFVLGSREPVLNELLAHASALGGNGYVCLVGAPGSGKSALLAFLYGRLLSENLEQRTENQPLVITHFVGASPGSTDMRRTLRRLCHELKKGCPEITTEIPDDFEKLRAAFPALLQQACDKKRVVILLDAVNQFDATTYFGGLHWLPGELPANARVILSTLESPALEELRGRSLKLREIELKLLTAADCDAIIEQFRQRYHKRFTSDQRAALRAKTEAGTPLYLLTALEELRTLGTYEVITQRIAKLPSTTQELFDWILERLENDDGFRNAAGRKIGKELVSRFAALLGASRHGLSQCELFDLLAPGDPLGNVAAVLHLLRPYLMLRGDLLDFYHGQFRGAAEQKYLQTETQRCDAHAGLAAHFNLAGRTGQPWQGAHRRSLTEFPYHLWQSGAREPLFALAQNEGFLSAQQEGLSEDPDLPFRTLRMALDAACSAQNPVAMAEFTLTHAYRLDRQQAENPLAVLLNARLAPDVALQRVWGLADALEPQSRAYALLLLAWKLKTLNRHGEAGTTLKKLDEKPIPFAGDYTPLIMLLLGWLEPDFDTSHWAPVLLFDLDLTDLTVSLVQSSCLESAYRIASAVRDQEERALALCEVAKSQSRAGQDTTSAFAEVQSMAKHIEDAQKRAWALRDTAKAQAEAGYFPAALTTAAVIEGESERASALIEVATAQAKAGQDWRSTIAEAHSIVAGMRDARRLRFEPPIDPNILDKEAARGAQRDAVAQACVWHLIDIAKIQAHAGHDASSSFAEAHSAAEMIGHSSSRSEAFRGIAQAQIKLGQLAEANSTANRTSKYSRAHTLREIAKAQALAGRFAEARSTIAGIQYISVFCDALCDLALAQARAGQDSGVAFAEAKTTAQHENPKERARVLNRIALAQAQAGQDATSTFDEAKSAARQVKDAKDQADILKESAAALAQAGQDATSAFGEAKSAAQHIKDAQKRGGVLKAIATTQAQAGCIPDAQSTAAVIDVASERYEALSEIAKVQVQAGQNATSTLTEALCATTTANKTSVPVCVLCEIAETQVQAGQDATLTFAEAQSMTARSGDSSQRVSALLGLARAQARVGHDAAPTLTEIQITVAQIENAEDRTWALGELGKVQAHAGRFVEALSTAAEIEDELKRISALTEIAKEQALAGLCADAQSTAAKIVDEWRRSVALREIVEAQAQSGQFADAQSMAERIKGKWAERDVAFRKIVEAQAHAGQFAEAQSTLTRIEGGSERAWALSAIIKAMAEAGHFTEAKFQAARFRTDTPERSGSMGDIAVAQAQAGRFSEAESTASEIQDDKVWRDIAIAQAQAGLNDVSRFAKAQATAAKIGVPWFRAEALYGIAIAQAHAGRFADAESIAAEIGDMNRDHLYQDMSDKILLEIARKEAEAGGNATFAEALSKAAKMDNWKRDEPLLEIVKAQAQIGELKDALCTADMILRDQTRGINEVGFAMIRGENRNRARSVLSAYLPRAARYVESAWHSCGVIAQLYPDKSSDLANFLIVFSRKLRS